MSNPNPAGNVYDKFSARNPIARWMMKGFKASLHNLLASVEGSNVLEIGCGEGYIQPLVAEHKLGQQYGFDIDYPIVVQARDYYSEAFYSVASAENIPFPTKSFDVVLAIEVMEHVENPEKMLKEMLRVCRQYVLVSVPREPIWRILNIARLKYLKTFGNTPGHINHWSTQSFVRFLENDLQIIQINRPLPWTMVLCRTR